MRGAPGDVGLDRKRSGIQALLLGLLAALLSCATHPPESHPWGSLKQGLVTPSWPSGIWESKALGHLVSLGPSRIEVFHSFSEFCIRDSGLVPDYSLYAKGSNDDELLLHYFDYRGHEQLLQVPLRFRRLKALPNACASPSEEIERSRREIFQLVWAAFDRHYAFFEERGIDWQALKNDFEPRVQATRSDAELFDLLSEMLGELRDGHVNLRWEDRFFNAARPRLRTRLAEAWREGSRELSEREFVSRWHGNVLDSVDAVLDDGSLKSGAAGALSWGLLDRSVGYLRINRFRRFSDEDEVPRRQQMADLRSALDDVRRDLAAADRLIVDVAMNGGGNDAAGLMIAAEFADRRRLVIQYQVPGEEPDLVFLSPAGAGEDRPIFLLTSEVTASAAESFVLMMRAFPHVTQVGETTRGGLSSLLPKPFPGGFTATISYQRVLDAEGALFEVRGIPPNREIDLFPDGNLQGGLADAIQRLAGRKDTDLPQALRLAPGQSENRQKSPAPPSGALLLACRHGRAIHSSDPASWRRPGLSGNGGSAAGGRVDPCAARPDRISPAAAAGV